MCWIENIERVDIQIADRDIEVYKVVLEADKQSCISCVQGFAYEANTLYKMMKNHLLDIVAGKVINFARPTQL